MKAVICLEPFDCRGQIDAARLDGGTYCFKRRASPKSGRAVHLLLWSPSSRGCRKNRSGSGFPVPACRRGGHFIAASVWAEADWRSRFLNSAFLVIDHAALGCGGGMVLCRARRLRFWTVAISRNSSRAPDSPRNLSLNRERTCLTSAKSISIFFRSSREIS